jgi:hypothetical protein
MLNLNIESVIRFEPMPGYGRIWLVEFGDYETAIVAEQYDIEHRWHGMENRVLLSVVSV